MNCELRLVLCAHAMREPTAWLVPGGEAAAWLSAAAQTGVALSQLELRLIPRSAHDRTPIAALLTGPTLYTRPTPQAQPYALVAERLFVPTHARLDPAVTDAELATLLATPSAVFHPSVGLVGYEPGEVLRLMDLLSGSALRATAWSMPEPGAGVGSRLVAIEPTQVMTLEELDAQLGVGLGDKPLSELPPTDDEGEPGTINKAGQGMVGGLAGVLGWLASKAPATSGRPTWIDKLGAWANARQNTPQRADQRKRNQEINRLLDMLGKKSAEALSYAIPLSGLSQARGMGQAGNELTRQNTGFSLGGMYGGGPADPWEIAEEQRRELSKRYREMAVNEAAAGRYRRAAYIYGKLLGDADAAARVLEEGGHYREAAVILRDKLRQPVAAARCLERGGLFADAIALYLDRDRWIEAASLYERLEQHEQAERWYRHAADRHAEARQYLAAAKLYEQKLHDLEATEQALRRGAVAPLRDAGCLAALFDFAGRTGRHAPASDIIEELTADAEQTPVAGRLARSLAEAHRSYPEPAVRQQLEDATLGLAGLHLPRERSESQARIFTDAVRHLAPDDRLLGRDAQRYITQLSRRSKPMLPARPADRSECMALTQTLALPDGDWHAAFAAEGQVLAIGQIDEKEAHDPAPKLWVARATESLCCDYDWLDETACEDPYTYARTVHAAARPEPNGVGLAVFLRGRPGVKRMQWRPIESGPAVSVETPAFLPSQTLALSGDAPRLLWALVGTQADAPEYVLNAYNNEGALIQSINVALSPQAILSFSDMPDEPLIGLHARREEVILAIGRVVLRFANGKQVDEEIMGGPIVQIAGAAAFARSRYALAHITGVTVVWNHAGTHHAQRALQDVDGPIIAFTNNAGLLVAADADSCRILSTHSGKLSAIDRIIWPGRHQSRPVSVVPLGRGDDFAVLFADGTLRWYAVTPPPGARY
ncbi:hypothetical protein OT109_09440 [Phycisphaeraceae bacterium D3-23]